ASAPAAPGLLITTTGTGTVSLTASDSWRAIWSAEPPGAKPTRISMGRVGVQSCATAGPADAAASRAPASHLRAVLMGSPPLPGKRSCRYRSRHSSNNEHEKKVINFPRLSSLFCIEHPHGTADPVGR